MPTDYYIISLKWTKRADCLISFWGPKAAGYVYRLEIAGRYTAEEIAAKPDYYNDGERTIAVPCTDVERFAIRVGDAESKNLDVDRDVDQRVVAFKHLRSLIKSRATMTIGLNSSSIVMQPTVL